MKAQMRFQKYICLVMLIMGAITLLYAFCYCTGSLAQLGKEIDTTTHTSNFTAASGKYDALLYSDIQGFNNMLMFFGIFMILFAVLLYITSCNKRRNYYISNYVAIGVCAGGDFILSLVALIMNAVWKGKFLNIDFESWYNTDLADLNLMFGGDTANMYYSDSTIWFDVGYVVYILMMVAAIILVLNLVWKIMLMKGEKKLLSGNALSGGVA